MTTPKPHPRTKNLPSDRNSKQTHLINIISGPGSGKCHGKDTPILMYDGQIKMVQDITVGEQLMGDDSTPRIVLNVSHGKEELYRVNLQRGDSFVVNKSHILSVKCSGLSCIYKTKQGKFQVSWRDTITSGRSKTVASYEEATKFLQKIYDNGALKTGDILDISIEEYLSLSKKLQSKLKAYRCNSLSFEAIDVPIDPYAFGYWLGDGSSAVPVIHTIDEEIIKYFTDYCQNTGLILKQVSDVSYHLSSTRSRFIKNWFIITLRNLKVINNKHIPDIYKINSRHIRLQLLAGLIDSDGYSDHRVQYEIVSVSSQLANDIVYLARSLGFYASVRISKKHHGIRKVTTIHGRKGENLGPYYRVIISGDNLTDIPVKLDRKKVRSRSIFKDPLVEGFTLEPLGIEEYYGFSISGNHRYVLGNFVVTHNTTICALLFARLKIKTSYSIEYIQEVAKSLVWEEDFELLDNQYWVSTKQYRLLNSLQNKVDLIITDGCLLHGIYYNRNNENNVSNVQKTENFIINSFHQFNNINIFLERSPDYPYEQAGRYQTEEEAKGIDLFFKTYLDQHNIPYKAFRVQEDQNIDEMIQYIESQLEPK